VQQGDGEDLAMLAESWRALPVPVLDLSPEGQALQANAAFEALTGLSAPTLHGTGWLAALAPDRRAALFEALSRPADFELDVRMLRADESKAWVRMRAHWRRSARAFRCVLQDITAERRLVQEAQSQSQRFRQMADNVPVQIAYFERAGLICSYANRQYAASFGFDEHAVVGRRMAEIIGEAAAREIQPHIDAMLAEGRTVSYSRALTGARAGAAPRWIDVSLVPHPASDGTVLGAFVLITDITRHRLAEAAVRESEDRLSKFMDASVEGIAFHRDGLVSDVNAPISALLGWRREELVGRHVLDFIPAEHLPRVRQGLADGSEQPYEAALLHREGHAVPVEFIVRNLARGGEQLRMVVVRDIRDRQAARERIHHLAHHDAVTGLLNRGALMLELQAALDVHREASARLALLFIDLDHFKRINDRLGHLAGDALLQAVAGRLVAMLGADAAVGRFGGDEFVIMLPRVRDLAQVRNVAEGLREAMEHPVHFEGQAMSVTPTIGVAMFPADGDNVDQLLRRADAAMYSGKAAGRATIRAFEPSMALASDDAQQLEARIAQGLARAEFRLTITPRRRPADGTLQSLQARVGWQHPQRGWLEAPDFAGTGEPRRALHSVADWALCESLALLRQWHALGLETPPLVLDLTVLQAHCAGLPAMVARVLKVAAPAFARGPHRAGQGPLQIELSERICADDALLVQRTFEQLQAQGVPVRLADFGAGGAAWTALRGLPLQALVLDRALVGLLPGDTRAAAIVRGLIDLAHGLGLTAGACRVDDAVQWQWLRQQGCDEVQGEAVEPVLTPEQAGRWLAAQPH
jgi:diguanylate cyclase (GGDEF)-like protein/PAS domain S-box-containing protein